MRVQVLRIVAGCGAMISVMAAVGVARADAISDFYGKNDLRMIIGVAVGGSYDSSGRLVARHIGRHVPGSPRVLIQNMPGASSRVAANHIYTLAPKDGTIIGAVSEGIAMAQALGEKGIRYDAGKFNWIGTPVLPISVMAVWHTAGVKTLEEAKNKEIIVGATSVSGTNYIFPALIKELLGAKFRIVVGYDGGNAINLAMERGEVVGRGSNAWASWKSTKADWLRDKKVNILVQIGLEKAPDLPDVPLLMDLAANDEDRAVLRLLSAPTAVGRPIFSTPNVPMDRVTALRRAFDATMTDAGFLAEAEKAQLDLNPVAGEKLQQIVEDIVAAPKPVARKLAAALVIRDVVRDLQLENPQPPSAN